MSVSLFTQPNSNSGRARRSALPPESSAAFRDPYVSAHIKRLRGRLTEARRGERQAQGSVRSDVNKFLMPKLVEGHPQLRTARAQTSTQQGRIAYMRLYNAALSTLTDQIIGGNWNNILTLDRDKQRDAKLQAKYGGNVSALHKARKAAHRVSIQRWWMLNKAALIQRVDSIISSNPDAALGWISSSPQAMGYAPASSSSSVGYQPVTFAPASSSSSAGLLDVEEA